MASPQDQERARRFRVANPGYWRRWQTANQERCREYNHRWYIANRERAASYARAYARRIRAEVLAAYGTSCVRCGSTERLELDHVNGDGRAHGIAIGAPEHGGLRFWLALKKRGWPTDPPIQVLCCTCHRRKGIEAERELARLQIGIR